MLCPTSTEVERRSKKKWERRRLEKQTSATLRTCVDSFQLLIVVMLIHIVFKDCVKSNIWFNAISIFVILWVGNKDKYGPWLTLLQPVTGFRSLYLSLAACHTVEFGFSWLFYYTSSYMPSCLSQVQWFYVLAVEFPWGELHMSVSDPLPVSQLQVPGRRCRVLNRVVLKDLQRKK